MPLSDSFLKVSCDEDLKLYQGTFVTLKSIGPLAPWMDFSPVCDFMIPRSGPSENMGSLNYTDFPNNTFHYIRYQNTTPVNITANPYITVADTSFPNS